MPSRGKIDTLLPADVRDRLDAKIVTQSFSDYRGLAAWLASEGYQISKNTIHRHGQELERKLEAVKRATAQARAIVQASPDDEGAMNDALIRLVQQINFDILVKMDEAGLESEEGIDTRFLGAITRSVASLARASVKQKEWMTEIRERLKQKVAAAESKVAEVARGGGLSDEAEAKIRAAIFDIIV